jgi:uncharacterized phage-associated protein
MVQPVGARPRGLLENIITYICFKAQPGTTKLMKLVYLADVYYARMFAKRLTDVPFVHFTHGAFAKEVYQALEALEAKGMIRERILHTADGHKAHIREPAVRQTPVTLSDKAREAIDAVLADWGSASLQTVIKYTKATLPFAGTKPSAPIDFSRVDPVREHAKARRVSEEDAATDAICSSPELVSAARKGDKAAREGRFVSWEEAFGED